MPYPCPFKGTKRGVPSKCDKDFGTIKGWKGHMSRVHTTWSEEQLARVVGAEGIDPERGKAAFLSEVDGVPGNGGKETSGEPAGEGVTGKPPTAPAPEPVKRVPLKSEKFRKFITALPEKVFKEKGIELDKEDKEFLDMATEMMEGLFGVAFEIPESMLVIRSRWMALLFPIGAVLLVYLKHTFSFDMFKKAEEGPETLDTAVKKAREAA